ncbi:hypothetical protein HME9302_01714 [Alteripontixanthobacter maritimus]|uniref:Acyl-CoA thioesterase n=1 Tax=Alteripontixanthobacter maritimus TaxID=2161824 RepID=A0A369Q714_9SPHN|nr:thioesterase family protein [Alteripontixanthobacter maritimus]RDC60504.1 hypothetical protein HME9302_01714 [Alteripontixanthobacter maritimus]
MAIAELLEPVGRTAGSFTLPKAAEWMQGRTMYGGASALIAYTATMRAFPDLPPMQAAQIGFVAPVGDTVEVHTEMLREGRNVTQLQTQIIGEKGPALIATFLFGGEREANALHTPPRPEWWPDGPDKFKPLQHDKAPAFIQHNFEVRRAQEERGPMNGSGTPTVRRWCRLKDTEGLDAMSELLLMGDVLPPAAFRVMQRMGPVSSINWALNVLNNGPRDPGGWWLAENATDHADKGYSSERQRLFDAKGTQVLAGLQSVAVFG